MTTWRIFRRIVVLSLMTVVAVPVAHAGETPKAKLHHAYYLEQADGDCAAAMELYQQVASNRNADREVRVQAKTRLNACREELASSNLAQLMPPDALAYFEINRPSDQVLGLLNKLGLVAGADQIVEEGARRVAISPALIQEILGIRGVAVAVTGFNPAKEAPTGVAILHPGRVEVIKGLIETALPVGGTAIEPIGGFATYDVEGEAVVTVTSKMIIAGTDRSQVEGVLRRMKDSDLPSLADNAALADTMKGGDSLLNLFINAKPVVPMIRHIIESEGVDAHEMAMAEVLLDLDNLNSLTGRLGVNDDGLALDIALRLDEGHKSLVFNFLRNASVDPKALDAVPSGVAALLVGALNESSSRFSSSSGSNSAQIVTLMDIGREFFGNIQSFAAFALPPDEGSSGGPGIPDAALAISVADPSKSEALWTQFLGIASLAAGGKSIEGDTVKIGGTMVRRYKLPDGIAVYFSRSDSGIVLATTKSAMARTMKASRKGGSIRNDKGFAANLSRLTPDTTKGLFIHAGRCARIAKSFMSERELAEAGPILQLLEDTSASVVVDHSDNQFRISAVVSGIPNIGAVVSETITREVRRHSSANRVSHATNAGKWDQALELIDAELAEDPQNTKLLRKKFKIVAVGKKDKEAAIEVAKILFGQLKDDATALNRLAWALLTEEQFGDQYDRMALHFSERSNELTSFENWAFMDTLALAHFKMGDAPKAATLERQAIQACGTCGGADALAEALTKFEGQLADAGSEGSTAVERRLAPANAQP